MKIMKDQFGNKIDVGDWVQVKVDGHWVMGELVKVQNGGISVSAPLRNAQGQPQVPITPDVIWIQLAVGFQSQPGNPQPGLLKVEGPDRSTTIVQ